MIRYAGGGGCKKQLLTVNSLPSLLTNLTHSFLLQNSPFLGAEVIKKITRTNSICPDKLSGSS